jgi:hypothetical protein
MAERTPSITSPLSEGVDISPISTSDRRNSLEKHLQTRPEEQDLKNRHILLGLGRRPERGELVDRELVFLLCLFVSNFDAVA